MEIKQAYFAVLEKTRKEHPDALIYAVSRRLSRWQSKERQMELLTSQLIELAPSERLHMDQYKKLITWDQFTERFIEEIKKSENAQKTLRELIEKSKTNEIFLVCHEGPKQGKSCHRFILLDMIKQIEERSL